MSDHQHALGTIVSANHIPQALTLYSYASETNPDSHFIIFLVGERGANYQLFAGPEWIWWDQLLSDGERDALAREYTPFELVCSIRGKVHHYLATCRQFQKWVIIDTDIGIYSSLKPIWDVLDSASIAFAPHAEKPVGSAYVPQHEGAFIKGGLFNGGVVAMKKSLVAEQASHWLDSRLRSFGHAFENRSAAGMVNYYDFEYVDQIWLNLLFLYFRADVALLDGEVFNLGHWNLHQGCLAIHDGEAFINGKRLHMAHFSGLPSRDRLSQVSIHSQLYIENPSFAWALLAQDYIDRLGKSRTLCPDYAYPYDEVQPSMNVEPSLASPGHDCLARINSHSILNANSLLNMFRRPDKLRQYIKSLLARSNLTL